MLQVDLLRLRRSRTLKLSASIAADHEIWAGLELKFAKPVKIDGSVTATAAGGVVVQGSWKAPMCYDCGRCLKELHLEVERPLTLVYVPVDGWQVSDPEVRTLGVRETTLDLAEAIREEIVLEVPRYLVPHEKEDGRCTECGDRVERFSRVENEPGPEIDPRWSALEALRTD